VVTPLYDGINLSFGAAQNNLFPTMTKGLKTDNFNGNLELAEFDLTKSNSFVTTVDISCRQCCMKYSPSILE
jgi:hypothetical protein